jgi:putative membrane protein
MEPSDVEHPESAVQASAERTAQMSNVFFRAPTLPVSLAGLGVLSVVAGLLLDLSPTGVVRGLVVVGLPGLVAAALSAPLAEALGGTLYARRAGFLSVVGAAVLTTHALATIPLDLLVGVAEGDVMLVGFMGVAAVRHGTLFTISDNRHHRTLPVTLLPLVAGLPALAWAYGLGWGEAPLVAGLVVVFLAPVVFFLGVFDSPLKENFSASASEIFRAYLDHLKTGSVDAERIVNRWSEPIDAGYGVVTFHRPEGDVKAVMVVPVLHPGPVGQLGGGDLPGKVAEIVDATDFVMVPHGPATHDYNPTTTDEVARFAERVRETVEGVEPGEGGSPAVAEGETVDVTSQFFGDGALLTYTSWPRALDDVDHGVGLAAELQARIGGAEEAVFADCHNSLRPGAGQVFLATPRAETIQRNARAATEEAARRRVGEMRVGVAQDAETFTQEEGIGGQGIQVLAVEAGDQRHAYVLWDGNNMLPEVNRRLGEEIEDLVDSYQLMTTDNHSVNAVAGAFGPVGAGVDPETLARVTGEIVDEALDDLEVVEPALERGIVEDVRVYGHHKTAMLTASINTMTSIAPELVGATLTLQALGTVILFLLL